MRLGTRTIYLLTAPIAAFTWVLVALSHQLWIIFISRVISGIIFGLFQVRHPTRLERKAPTRDLSAGEWEGLQRRERSP